MQLEDDCPIPGQRDERSGGKWRSYAFRFEKTEGVRHVQLAKVNAKPSNAGGVPSSHQGRRRTIRDRATRLADPTAWA
jgi:hypothetical protein